MCDDHDVKYHFQCQHCGRIFYVSYDEMVKAGWRVAIGHGYICPDCAGETIHPTLSIEEAQENRRVNRWESLVNP